MSYILEALKKADAERERGAVPDLHAQPVPLAAAYNGTAPRSAKHWLWLVGGAVIAAVVAVVAWQVSRSDAPPGIEPAAPLAPTAPAAPPAMPAPPPPAPIARPAPPAQQEAEPTPAMPAIRSAPPAKAAPRARVEPREPAVAAPSAASKAAKAAPIAASAPAQRAPLLAELPDDMRRQVPAMTIGGSVFSQQAANRMVIINGQVFREGSVVTPGLLLEQIGPKSAVFSLGGQRFEMPF